MELISKEDVFIALMCLTGEEYKYDEIIHRFIQRLQNVPTVFDIPDNVTNGQILQAVFPHAKISKSGDFICLLIDGQGDAQMLDVDWWDAPYKRGDLL